MSKVTGITCVSDRTSCIPTWEFFFAPQIQLFEYSQHEDDCTPFFLKHLKALQPPRLYTLTPRYQPVLY